MRLKNIRSCKRGMTLVELLIALSITGILIMATIGMLLAGTNLFAEQTNYNQCKQVGDACLDWISEQLLYAHGITLQTATTAADEPGYSTELLYFGQTAGAPATEGRLYWKDSAAAETMDVFGEAFYEGNIAVSCTLVPNAEEAYMTIEVFVKRNDELVYTNKKSISFLNVCPITDSRAADMPVVIVARFPAA